MSEQDTATYTFQKPLMVEGKPLKSVTFDELTYGALEEVEAEKSQMKMQRALLASMSGIEAEAFKQMSMKDTAGIMKVALPLMGNMSEKEVGDLLAGKLPANL